MLFIHHTPAEHVTAILNALNDEIYVKFIKKGLINALLMSLEPEKITAVFNGMPLLVLWKIDQIIFFRRTNKKQKKI
ncbi:MAG: hypothetical protein LRY67_03475 [Gammaproteobacteria bacterium]|nr:hypothetical protein [Gammaproteobacteria bacterium]